MSFDFELLMLKPTPQQDLEHGISIHFSQPLDHDEKEVPLLDRKQLMETLLPSLGVEWPTKMVSKMSSQTPIPMIQQEPEEPDEPEDSSSSPPDASSSTTLLHLEKNTRVAKAYQSHKDTVRGRLVIQSPGKPWICPQIALLEGESHPDSVICIYTPVSEKKWFDAIGETRDAEMQFWEYVSGYWQGTRDKPSNFRQLATVDQEAIQDQMLNTLKNKYKHINLLEEEAVVLPGESSVIILDDVENFCDAVLQKHVESVRLYNHFMALDGVRIVALTQYPCYRDPESLVLLFNLLHGYISSDVLSSSASSKKSTTVHAARKNPKGKKTRRNKSKVKVFQQKDLQPPQRVLLSQLPPPNEFNQLVSHMILLLDDAPYRSNKDSFFKLEQCEMTESQYELYQEETDAVMQRKCCTFAIPNPKLSKNSHRDENVIEQTLYEQELARIVQDQDVSVSFLEKYSPKFLRVLKKIQKEEKEGKKIMVFTHVELHGQLFCSMLEHHGFSEEGQQPQFVVVRTEGDFEKTLPSTTIYVIISSTTMDLWNTGAKRIKDLDTIHLLDIPEESWVQTLRIRRKVVNVSATVHLYVSTFSQTFLVKHRKIKNGLKRKLTSDAVDGSELDKYCRQYLGGDEVDALITADEQLLEDLLVFDDNSFKYVKELIM